MKYVSSILRYVKPEDEDMVIKLLGRYKKRVLKLAFEHVINRELNMRCLRCTKDLRTQIIQERIHIHLCKECRHVTMEKIITAQESRLKRIVRKVRH